MTRTTSRLSPIGGLLVAAALAAMIWWRGNRPDASLNPQPEPPG